MMDYNPRVTSNYNGIQNYKCRLGQIISEIEDSHMTMHDKLCINKRKKKKPILYNFGKMNYLISSKIHDFK